MPICNKCERFSNGQTADFCEHCGAKDWRTDSQKAAKEEFFRPVGVVGVVLWAVVVIGLLSGGLWLLVVLVKFMRQHS